MGYRLFIIFFLWFFSADLAHSGWFDGDFRIQVQELFEQVPENTKIAVSVVYDGTSGEVTALGDYWRDRIEVAIDHKKFIVSPRKDMVVLFNEHDIRSATKTGETFDKEPDLGVQIAISARYYILKGHPDKIELQIRALDLVENKIVESVSIEEKLPVEWVRMASRIHSNVYQQKFESLNPFESSGLTLSARLDQDPACYPAGSHMKIIVENEAAVHLYVFNLAADGTVTILFPNKFMPDSFWPKRYFVFPPSDLPENLILKVEPLHQNETTRESIKIVASKKPMDFGFLPIPLNHIYAGAKGGDLSKLLEVLSQSNGWAEVTLDYWVGADCHE